jgi:LCP family protein required for cell wall assembly
LRTTLKRGIGRGGVLDGNGHSVLPPSALTPMTRYRQPDPPRRSGMRVVGRVLGWIAAVLLVVVLGGVAGVYLWLHESVAALAPHSAGVKQAQKQLAPPPPPGKAAIALVIGYDHRANEAKGTPSRSDTVMLLRADPATKTVSMLSFPRDMVVNVHCPGHSTYVGKINSAYATCGEPGTLQTVEDLIGLPINYLIAVNFRGFKQVVNRLGGVWMDVDRRYYNSQGGSCYSCYAKINLQPGYQLLTGGSALDYVRYRHTDSDLFRVARQQQFVRALKYQLKHSFGLTKAIQLVGALTNNVEVAQGGGGDVSVRKVASYANFIYSLPSGHFIQTQLQGLTGYSELQTSQTNIQAAVQQWLSPDVEAGKTANAVALGNKVRRTTPAPAETSITVLNGNGVLGAAANAGYLLGQRGYRVVQPPPNATGNAPRSTYFPSKVYWNPSVPGSKAAAASVAKLFAPADAERLPAEIRPLQQDTMLTVVVGTPFHGTITPAPPVQVPQKRQPAHVVSNPYDTVTGLRAAAPKVRFALMTPTVVESSSAPDRLKPLYAYRIQDKGHAVRLVFRTAGGAYWGIEEMDWPDAPALADRSFRHNLGGREFDFYYNGAKLHMVVLRHGDESYWVVNSLLDDLSNETMIAIAKGLKPLPAK